MDYRVTGMPAEPFLPLYGLDEGDLARKGVRRVTADTSPGYPDRIQMRDAEVGETLLLVNFTSHDAPTPYRASHAIYVLEGATRSWDRVNALPPVMQTRLLSLRAFDAVGMMVAADVAEGAAVEPMIRHMLADRAVDHIDVHNARPGCFSGRVRRA